MSRIVLRVGVMLAMAGCSRWPTAIGYQQTYVVQADESGQASMVFPSEISSKSNKPPPVFCYWTTESEYGNPWYPMSGNDHGNGGDAPYCALYARDKDRWGITAFNLNEGEYASFIVIF
jgi:hypothetical protein